MKRLTAAVMIALLALAACGPTEDEAEPDSAPTTEQEVQTEEAEETEALPDPTQDPDYRDNYALVSAHLEDNYPDESQSGPLCSEFEELFFGVDVEGFNTRVEQMMSEAGVTYAQDEKKAFDATNDAMADWCGI